ncbi:MAG: DNA double-strand break repair nuclease NurA, partial [Acidobacteriota bacterium]
MIVPTKIIDELGARWSDFEAFELTRQDEAVEYGRALAKLATLSGAEILALVGETPSPGALPTAEVDRYRGLRVPFNATFEHHAAAREWAARILGQQVTVAVDGSQIMPLTDADLPVAAVQAVWFENHHTLDGRYERQIEFELLTPRDLQRSPGARDDLQTEQLINLRRFELELRTL